MIIEKHPAETLFKQFCHAYKKRDLAAVLKLFSPDIHMWGSGADEYRVGLAEVESQLQRDWSQSDEAEICIEAFIPTHPAALWTAACCSAKVVIGGVEHIMEQLRGTLVVKKVQHEWKITHMHASFPDPRNAENSSFPVK